MSGSGVSADERRARRMATRLTPSAVLRAQHADSGEAEAARVLAHSWTAASVSADDAAAPGALAAQMRPAGALLPPPGRPNSLGFDRPPVPAPAQLMAAHAQLRHVERPQRLLVLDTPSPLLAPVAAVDAARIAGRARGVSHEHPSAAALTSAAAASSTTETLLAAHLDRAAVRSRNDVLAATRAKPAAGRNARHRLESFWDAVLLHMRASMARHFLSPLLYDTLDLSNRVVAPDRALLVHDAPSSSSSSSSGTLAAGSSASQQPQQPPVAPVGASSLSVPIAVGPSSRTGAQSANASLGAFSPAARSLAGSAGTPASLRLRNSTSASARSSTTGGGLGRTLGEGAFGRVIAATLSARALPKRMKASHLALPPWLSTLLSRVERSVGAVGKSVTIPVAVKELMYDRTALLRDEMMGLSETHARMIASELFVHASLRHPLLPTLYGFARNSNKANESMRLIFEQLAGNLLEAVRRHTRDEILASPRLCVALFHIFDQILDALMLLHSHDIMHLDVHPGQILLTSLDLLSMPHAKLGDFSLSQSITATVEGADDVAVPSIQPPELQTTDKRSYSKACDVYQFAVTFLWSFFAYRRDQARFVRTRAACQQVALLLYGDTPAGADAAQLFTRCLASDPQARPAPLELRVLFSSASAHLHGTAGALRLYARPARVSAEQLAPYALLLETLPTALTDDSPGPMTASPAASHSPSVASAASPAASAATAQPWFQVALAFFMMRQLRVPYAHLLLRGRAILQPDAAASPARGTSLALSSGVVVDDSASDTRVLLLHAKSIEATWHLCVSVMQAVHTASTFSPRLVGLSLLGTSGNDARLCAVFETTPASYETLDTLLERVAQDAMDDDVGLAPSLAPLAVRSRHREQFVALLVRIGLCLLELECAGWAWIGIGLDTILCDSRGSALERSHRLSRISYGEIQVLIGPLLTVLPLGTSATPELHSNYFERTAFLPPEIATALVPPAFRRLKHRVPITAAVHSYAFARLALHLLAQPNASDEDALAEVARATLAEEFSKLLASALRPEPLERPSVASMLAAIAPRFDTAASIAGMRSEGRGSFTLHRTTSLARVVGRALLRAAGNSDAGGGGDDDDGDDDDDDGIDDDDDDDLDDLDLDEFDLGIVPSPPRSPGPEQPQSQRASGVSLPFEMDGVRDRRSAAASVNAVAAAAASRGSSERKVTLVDSLRAEMRAEAAGLSGESAGSGSAPPSRPRTGSTRAPPMQPVQMLRAAHRDTAVLSPHALMRSFVEMARADDNDAVAASFSLAPSPSPSPAPSPLPDAQP